MMRDGPLGVDLGDDEPNGARAHVEHADQFGGGGRGVQHRGNKRCSLTMLLKFAHRDDTRVKVG